MKIGVRLIIACLFWLSCVGVSAALSLISVRSMEQALEEAFAVEASRVADVIARSMDVEGATLDESYALPFVMGAVMASDVEAVVIRTEDDRPLAGQRRERGESPQPWAGTHLPDTLKAERQIGDLGGTVEVYLSRRNFKDSIQAGKNVELWRFASFTVAATFMLALFLGISLRGRHRGEGPAQGSGDASFSASRGRPTMDSHVDMDTGLAYMMEYPKSAQGVAACLGLCLAGAAGDVRELHAHGRLDDLARLVRNIESIAPCMGAERLYLAAHSCAKALEGQGAGLTTAMVDELAAELALVSREGLTLGEETVSS